MSAAILVVEDHDRTRDQICRALGAHGYRTLQAADGVEALRRLRGQRVDLVLSDYRMGPMDGLSLLQEVRRSFDTPFILYSAGADAEAVFRAGRDGAFFFLEYPFQIEEQLLPTVQKGLRRPSEPLPREPAGADRFTGGSAAAHRVRNLIQRVARSRVTVLVTGETGTGKEVVARALHEESGRERFVALAVTELAEDLLDSELFGHERGAFTGAVARRAGLFEEADGGTLFLDEIGDAPPAVQAKLLRVLETGQVRAVGGSRTRRLDARVIAATHRDLQEEVREGRFRQDLFFRIHQVTIPVPPLRERPEDLEPLARALLRELCRSAGMPEPEVGPAFLEALAARSWTGNVRELRSTLQHVLLWWDGRAPLGRGELLEAFSVANPTLNAEEALLCQQMIEACRRSGWNQEAARRELGLSRGEWRHRWSRFGLGPLGRRRR